ncbi:MAG: tRNA nucleotidyltransferase/poly(A) polymerase family protein [Eubacteriales bacterium]
MSAFARELLGNINNFALVKNTKVYIVGGLLRDLYLGSAGRDLDFAVSGNAVHFAEGVAKKLGGSFILLDRLNGVARVVLEHQGEKWQVDFATLKGFSIEEDLLMRDFTINAMAVELPAYLNLLQKGLAPPPKRERWRWQDVVLDPCGGMADLENKIIRAVSDYAFESDPLRILRGVRLAGQLKFALRPETISLIENSRWLLHEVAGERIWEEFLGILALPESYPWLALMDAIGLLSELFPFIEKLKVTANNTEPSESVWVHSMKTYQILEDICREFGNSALLLSTSRGEELRALIVGHLHSPVGAGRQRYQLLKLAPLFHDAGKADTATVNDTGRTTFPGHHQEGLNYVSLAADRLKWSKHEESYLKSMVENHLYPLYLFVNQPVSPAAIHRFFTKLGRDSTDVLLLSLADLTATYITGDKAHDLTRYRTFAGDMLNKYFFQADQYVSLPPLVNGDDLIADLGIAPSKTLGELLKRITEAQVRGEVASREEAINYARNILGKLV